MKQETNPSIVKPTRVPCNKGKLIGAKPPLRASHVWSLHAGFGLLASGVRHCKSLHHLVRR